MLEGQLDLFADVGASLAPSIRQGAPVAAEPADSMDDASLIAAIPISGLTDSCVLAAEAGRRRLVGAIPALAALCRLFAGFGTRRPVPEQVAAIAALAAIGGPDAGRAVAEIIERAVVQGPTLKAAADAAARLGSFLSAEALLRLLRHDEPSIRADACLCARGLPEVIAILTDLLGDLDRSVASAAALALARMGRAEARPVIKSLLRRAPSQEVIVAAASIADEECAVSLGWIARSRSALAAAAVMALEDTDHPRASAILAGMERSQPPRTQESGPS